MSDLTHVDFLQQAYHDNWQQYLASLKPHAKLGWDVCVLTASDERQANMYRGQLEWRRTTNLLPAQTRFLVIADPDGQRIGSGGATLRVLAQLAREDDTLTSKRILIIHSGGDSRRLPICSATGKLFARVPRVLPDGRASTVFDEFLIGLSGLSSASLPPGVLVASGDVLLVFDHLQISFQRGGVIGVAAAAPVDMGLRHGVYVHGDGAHRVQAYLHKPSADELKHWNAIYSDGTVQIDTGLVWLDAATALKYAALIQSEAVGAICRVSPFEPTSSAALNFYGDLVLPLAQSTTLEDYLADTSDGLATPEVQKARQVIWQRLRGTSFTSERLHPAMFIHFGTSREYWETVASDAALQRICGWVSHAAAWSAGDVTALSLINSAVEQAVSSASSDQRALIVDSCLRGSLAWRGAAIIANVETVQPIELAENAVLDQLPLEQGFVTRIFGLYDDPKRNLSAGTFLNQRWPDWLAAARWDPEVLWPNVPADSRTLWNARLYPIAPIRDDSLALTLPLQDPARAPADWRAKWEAAPRLSLAASFVGADSERILQGLIQIEDFVAARHFYMAILDQQPAAEARSLIGSMSGNVARRCALINSWLTRADPIVQLRGYKALAIASEQSDWEDRAFTILAQMIESTVNEEVVARAHEVQLEHGRNVQVKAAARIDFGGGWTDTPPYSIEQGGTVLNAAITLRGLHPIMAEALWLDEPCLILESPDIEARLEPATVGELLNYANPADLFALQKAALVLKGVVSADLDPNVLVRDLCQRLGGGLKLITQTSIPRGSGLGTSSIMAGAVLHCLSQLVGLETTPAQLFDEVLCLEQMLTTGGGWQDQAGGLWGGIKLINTAPGLPQQIQMETIKLSPETKVELASRLVLVYTGRQRLAKNLLRSVMGRWMARDPEMVWIQQEIARLAVAMREALLHNDVSRFGELLSEHWVLNKRMDPGCTNDFIDHLFEVMSPHINGAKLAGAGGGGFAIVVARSITAVRDLAAALKSHYVGTPVEIWECDIPEAGMLVQSQVSSVVDRV
ncbi:MAG TPA: L-fucokinase [Anaerolineae bacterium]|nr:L-fucokinase [Anaerolineae bacterium]